MVEPMPDEWVEFYSPIVRRVSAQYAKRYAGIVERDDIQQECWMWFATHTNKMTSWLSEHAEDVKIVDRLVVRSLQNACHDFCHKQKLKTIGAEPDDVFWYSASLVKLMLPGAIAGDWKRVQDLSETKGGGKDASEQGDWMAVSADIQKAYMSLSETDRQLVFDMYVADGGAVKAHRDTHASKEASGMAANRAVKKMVRFLGGSKPFKDDDVVSKPDSEDVTDE